MPESALQLRRRCLFLFDEAVMGPALLRTDIAAVADDILLNSHEPQSPLASAFLASAQRWAQHRSFADWEECVEWLLFEAGRGSEVGRQRLMKLVALFVPQAQAHEAAVATFAENYWNNVRRRECLFDDDKNDVVPAAATTRVTWSVAADLPLLVEQMIMNS